MCAAVCVRRMTYVTHTGSSAELWRFYIPTRIWQRVDNGAGPSARSGHVMTSVRLDLWVRPDSGEGDACVTRAPLLLLRCDRDSMMVG